VKQQGSEVNGEYQHKIWDPGIWKTIVKNYIVEHVESINNENEAIEYI
jgi:hypothetical protein